MTGAQQELKTTPSIIPAAFAVQWRRFWPESGAMNAIPALDGMRALAVLLVMLFHSWSFVPGSNATGSNAGSSPLFYGKTGVQLFFVLSGFLLFLPYAQWIFGLRERPSTRMFYRRRALRVGPAYWASLVILGLTLPFTLTSLRDVIFHVFFLSNLSWQTAFTINGVYWTMAIEVQFYVLLPLIALGMYGLSRRVRPGVAAALMALLFATMSISCYVLSTKHSLSVIPVASTALFNYSAMPYWIGVFGSGIGCSMLYVYVTKVARNPISWQPLLRPACTVAGALGVLFPLAFAIVPPLRTLPALDLWFGVAYAGLLLGVLFGAKPFRAVFTSRPVRFVGLISYSFYIWHRVVLHAIAPHLRVGGFWLNVVVLFLVGTLLSVCVSYLSYQAFERPFIQARKKSHDRAGQVALEMARARLTSDREGAITPARG